MAKAKKKVMSSDAIKAQVIDKMPKQLTDFDEWARRCCVAMDYLIVNRQEHVARCTRCGKSFRFTPGLYETHLQKIPGSMESCPNCKNDFKVLHDTRGRRGKTEWFRALVFARRGRTIWAALWECEANFESINAFKGEVKIFKDLVAVYRFNSDRQEYFRVHYDYYGKRYEQHKTPNVPYPRCGIYGATKFDFTYAKTDNLRELFLKSDAKYLLINNAEWMPPELLIRHLTYGLKYQAYELLSKAGFYTLAMERIDGIRGGGTTRHCNWRGTSLEKILKLPKRWVRYLSSFNPNHAELACFRKLTEEERKVCPWELIEEMARHWKGVEEYKADIEKYAPFLKWAAFVRRQVEDPNVPEFGHFRSDYLDYIEMAISLGWDITKNRILYPDNLKERHDQAVMLYKQAQDAAIDRMIEQNARTDQFEGAGYMIVPARTQEDLNKESAKLCHCVKTYGKKIAAGSCFIFFIRRKEDPDTPYYTLETTPAGKLVQCRGKHNCSMTEPVKLFAEAFTKSLQKQIKKEGKAICQTA